MVLDTLSQHPPMDPSCSTPSPAASTTATLDTIFMEDSFLVRPSVVYFNPDDSEILKFTQLARSADPYFCIIHKFSVALLARQIHLDTTLLLVIP